MRTGRPAQRVTGCPAKSLRRRGHDAWRDLPTVRQATLVDDGTPEARRALEGRAPALLQARPKSQTLAIDYDPAFGAVAQVGQDD